MAGPQVEVSVQGMRHARVLPSFAVAFASRSLTCTSLGNVNARELLAWSRPGLPSHATAAELRAQFVKRRRASFDAIWDSCVNVRIGDDWRRALNDAERLRLAPLVSTDESANEFRRLTLRTVKERLRMPVAEALGVLAKLEALYWVPMTQPPATVTTEQALADVPSHPELVERVRSCAASPWVQALDPDDLRFPSIDGVKLAAWALAQVDKHVLSGMAHEICRRMIAAHKATWAEELSDLALAAINHAEHRPGSDEAEGRWLGIFLARYGGPRGLSLKAVGERYGITRERVRQICEYMMAALRAQPVKMPALERLLAAAARVMPLSTDEADSQLTRLLGENVGLLAAMRFADEMGLANPVRRSSAVARTHAGYKPLAIVEAVESSPWVGAAMSHARRDCTYVGCTNFIRIAGLLALEQGIAQDLETLQTVFSRAPGFRMLDSDSGWFTLEDSETSAAATRMLKLMSVASGSVDLDTVASALMTDDRWFYREGGRAMAVPPLHVLASLFAGWSWLTGNGHNKYVTTEQIDPCDVLSKTERAAVEALRAHGGVATRAEIATHLIDSLGVSNAAVSQVLATSSTVSKLDHAIYGVRGHPLATEALVDARKRKVAEYAASSPAAEYARQQVDVSAPIRTMVTQSGSTVSPVKRVVYLPRYLSEKITGDFEHCNGKLPAISVRGGNQIRKLAKAAELVGIGPSERFEIVFDLQRRTYELPRSSTTL